MAAVGDNHFFIVLVALVVIYFLWMDLALYYKLQSGYEELLVVQAYDANNATAAPKATSGGGIAWYDPFKPISVKLLMLDHMNHYIYYPACWWLDTHLLHVSDKLLFISPDAISLSHVLVAAAGAKLIVSDSLNQRRIGVILFELRSLLDSYDGMVARARANTRALTQVSGSWGYWMDGICDAVGTVLFFVGCWVLLQRRSLAPRNRARLHGSGSSSSSASGKRQRHHSAAAAERGSSSSSSSLPPSSSDSSSGGNGGAAVVVSMSAFDDHHCRRGIGGAASTSTENLFSVEESSPFISSSGRDAECGSTSTHHHHHHHTSGAQLTRVASVTILALLAQQFFSSLFWNRYMQSFHELLEVPYKVMQGEARDFQVNTMKSSPFWIISWSWKLINPHSLMSILLCFVFFDCAGSVFLWLRYLGFIPLMALVAFSEAYMQTVMWHSLGATSATVAR